KDCGLYRKVVDHNHLFHREAYLDGMRLPGNKVAVRTPKGSMTASRFILAAIPATLIFLPVAPSEPKATTRFTASEASRHCAVAVIEGVRTFQVHGSIRAIRPLSENIGNCPGSMAAPYLTPYSLSSATTDGRSRYITAHSGNWCGPQV